MRYLGKYIIVSLKYYFININMFKSILSATVALFAASALAEELSFEDIFMPNDL